MLITAIPVILAIGFYFYVNHELGKVEAMREEVKKNNHDSETVFKLERSINQIQKEAKSIDDYFIDSNNIVSFIKVLEDSAKKEGVTLYIDSLDILRPSKENKLKVPTVEMNLKVSGSLVNENNFIKALENVPYALAIKESRFIKNTDSKTGQVSWNLDLSVTGVAE